MSGKECFIQNTYLLQAVEAVCEWYVKQSEVNTFCTSRVAFHPNQVADVLNIVDFCGDKYPSVSLGFTSGEGNNDNYIEIR